VYYNTTGNWQNALYWIQLLPLIQIPLQSSFVDTTQPHPNFPSVFEIEEKIFLHFPSQNFPLLRFKEAELDYYEFTNSSNRMEYLDDGHKLIYGLVY
jgi:hypothetical protein